MAAFLVVLGMLVAFVGATGPAYMFLIPKLNPDLWYRLGLCRSVLVGFGSAKILLAWGVWDASDWTLILIPILIGLRTLMRPDRVIRALDTPRYLTV
ncbi:MAG: hypothetical protein ACK2T7_02815, partial [Anaerolineales bacterium]